MALSLMDYVTNRNGEWGAAATSDEMIELAGYDDSVSLQGPLSLNVSVVAETTLVPASGGGAARTSISDLYSYDVEVPAGYVWRYDLADSPAGRRVSGFRVRIRRSPCGCPEPTQKPDLPCDYAVCSDPNIGQFFPVACEPCGAGPVRLPPTCGPSLAVTPASGGCIRPRFFNGMFVTREDLETQLRYFRLKNQLQRRADGDGVVWGLGLGRDGSAVRVCPGYAVDCCGNDITLTSEYRVDETTLLSDPAICNLLTRDEQCFSLLLEYIECPEQPRPVHGADPCSGAPAGCEMSRVRETARLRLAPTRTYQPKGPIQRFLAAIGQNGGQAQGGGETGSVTTPATTFPFTIDVTSPDQGANFNISGGASGASDVTLTPSLTATQSTTFVLLGGTRLTFTAPTAGQASMTGGSVAWSGSPTGMAPQSATSGASGAISWTVNAAGEHAQTVYTLSNWTMPAGPAAADGVYSGSTAITVTAYSVEDKQVYFRVDIAPSQVTLTKPPTAPFPCLGDACCGTTPLFPVSPPWADASPFKPGQAADLDVILMAVLYVLIAGEVARGETINPAVIDLYAKVAQLVDPNASAPAVLDSDTEALRRMLSDLCCSLLYPGPSCDGEPHGVVIGCASVRGGRIERVDPWSGRRWVMHYPLWSYWGEQFGIVPADVLASRLFSFICCVAGLKGPAGSPTAGRTTGAGFESELAGVPVGAGRIVLDASAAKPAAETVSLPIFAARVMAALASGPAPAGAPISEVALDGNPAIRLQVADPAAAPASQNATPATPAAPADAVQAAFTAPKVNSALPPLLRSFAATLGAGLIDALPVKALEPPAAVLAPLTVSGVASVGDVLRTAPDTLFQTVLDGNHADSLSNLVTKAEAKPAEIAQAVVKAIKAVGLKRSMISKKDLVGDDAQAALAAPLAQTLGLPTATVTAAIAAALT
jgi:hypothetical protein